MCEYVISVWKAFEPPPGEKDECRGRILWHDTLGFRTASHAKAEFEVSHEEARGILPGTSGFIAQASFTHSLTQAPYACKLGLAALGRINHLEEQYAQLLQSELESDLCAIANPRNAFCSPE
jgi:hypothetical protein